MKIGCHDMGVKGCTHQPPPNLRPRKAGSMIPAKAEGLRTTRQWGWWVDSLSARTQDIEGPGSEGSRGR